MPFRIREANPKDAEAACKVLRHSIEQCCADDHKNDAAILSSWLANKTPEIIRTWFNPPAYAVIAEQDGESVGVALLGGSGVITLNYLLPEARFQGIGKAMLGALEKEAERRGLTELELSSTATAHGFYLRNGYFDTGKKSSMFGLHAPIMRKLLETSSPPLRSSVTAR
jgi:GNAT superfamily N-acetyltransferase